ncbi:MAG: hypothetical protein R3C68_09230 [Myxococcota bacterium]
MWCSVVLAALGLIPVMGNAKDKRTVALFPFVAAEAKSRRIAPAYYKKVAAQFRRASTEGAIRFVYGKQLRKQLGANTARAIERCAGDVACVAGLGQRAKVDEVISVQVERQGDGLQAFFMIINVSQRSIARSQFVTFSNLGAVEKELAAHQRALLGISGDAAVAPKTSENLAALPRLLPIHPGPRQEEPMLLLPALPKSEGPATAQGQSDSSKGRVRGSQDGTAQESRTRSAETLISQSAGNAGGWMLPSALAAGGVAVALGATGAFFGARAASADKTSAREGRTQLEFQTYVDHANDDASLANVLFIGSAATAVTGAVLFVIHALSDRESPSPSAALEATAVPGGLRAALSVPW